MNDTVQKEFINDHQSRFSPATICSYSLSIRQFFTFCKKSYTEVQASDIRAWLANMEKEGLKPRSIHLKLSALKSFYQYCLEENKMKNKPTATVHTPKLDDSLPYYLSMQQLVLLREHVQEDIRERAIVETLYATGLRINELLHIKLEDIQWEKKQICIRRGKGRKERFVLFTEECKAWLKAYLNERNIESDYLFCNRQGNHLSRDFVEKKFQSYSKVLGFKIVPHTMRHTFAAHLTTQEMPQSYIQELLGHVNINSTRIYTRLTEQSRKIQYDKYQL